MRKYFLIIAIFGIALQGTLHDLYGQTAPYNQSDYGLSTGPMPFAEIDDQDVANKSHAAVSTGYMFMSNQSGYNHPLYQWRPTDYRTTYPNIINSQGGNGVLMSTEFEPNLWHRVYPGYYSAPVSERERQVSPTEIGLPLNNLNQPAMPREGFRYFRNPAQRFDYTAEYSPVAIDSNKNSFAGPIPIGFAFYMNGLRYDSFYVSTCGIIALSNRRYFYDGDGNRVVPSNESDCYDPNSADWPFRSVDGSTALNGVAENSIDVDMGRYHTGRGNAEFSRTDPTEDNYGFVNIACGGDIDVPTGGIRGNMTAIDFPADGPCEFPSIMIRLSDRLVSGGAYITPFEGPFYLPQTNKGVPDDRGKVWYKRNAAGNNLIIYFENFHMQAGEYRQSGATQNPIIYNIVEGRVGETEGIDGVLEGSVQVELNGLDNSITFRYGDWRPAGSSYTIYGETKDNLAIHDNKNPWDFFQPFASIAIGGYARHKNYNSKTQLPGEGVTADNPWAGQYAQWTNFATGFTGADVNTRLWRSELFTNSYNLKFKQWRNALRLVDVQYKMRRLDPTATAFDKNLNTAAAGNLEDPIELLAGHAQLGRLQPVVLVQNLTNDIQGQDGVNFVEQEFQFQSHVRIANKITEKIIYNRVAKIADTCLYDFTADQHGFGSVDLKTAYCGAEQVVWTHVTKDQAGNYISDPYSHDEYIGEAIGYSPRSGISPYNYVQVVFPTFIPNRNVSDQLGLMELTTFTDATHPITGAVIGDEWTLDDTANTSFWVISNVPDFRSNGEYHYHYSIGAVPDITKWVHSSISPGNPSVRVVPGGIGAENSHNPLPPLGNFRPVNDMAMTITSPMYRFGSSKASGGNWSKLTSFPVDLRNNTRSMVSLAVQKGEHSLSKDRGFSDNQMVGPEARVFFDVNSRSARYLHESGVATGFGRMTGFGGSTNGSRTFEPYPDYLFVEYLSPSPDNVKNIVSTGVDTDIDGNINNTTYQWENGNNGTSNNIPNTLWRGHRAFNTINNTFTPVNISYAHSPALAVFGGGGYYLGWTFADGKTFFPASWNSNRGDLHDAFGGSNVVTLNKYDPSVPYSNTKWAGALEDYDTIVAGLMPNPYDIGFDDQFYRYSVIIPDYYIIMTTQTTDPGANFRFRIRVVDVAAKMESDYPVGAAKGVQGNPSDDEDVFLVDNIAVVKQTPSPDIEMQAVNIPWPYVSAPINQATDLQVISRLANMGQADARAFNVKIRVYRGELGNSAPINIESAIYCQSISVSGLPKGESTEITASNLNLSEFATSTYPGSSNVFTVQAIVNTNKLDQYGLNDTIYSHFTLTVDTVMKYVSSTTNEVAAEVGLPGKGLNLGAHSIGGYMVSQADAGWAPTRNGQFRLSNAAVPHGGLYMNFWDGNLPRISYVCGGNLDGIFPGNSHDFISGQLAVKFEIRTSDSVRGVVAYFGGANQAFDDISFNIYNDNNGLPGTEVSGTNIPPLPLLARRLYAKAADGRETFVGPDAPVLYEFSRPVHLPTGTYWVSIDQRSETGFEVAATGESMGMRTMVIAARNDRTENAPLGDFGMQLLVDRRLRVATDSTEFGAVRVYKNNNIFAYKNIMHTSSNWQPFMPTIGQVAYPHLNHLGMLNPQRNNYQTYTRGTWAPLVMPYFGARTVAANNNTAICPDEPADGGGQGPMAINITSFVGVGRGAGIELYWEAISANDNNSHFIIERQEADEVNTWTEVERVLGSVEKSTVKSHKWLDTNVTAGKTYRYRLYQMYDDGSLTCQNSHTATVAYNPEYSIDLAQNSPNPFNSQTNIDVTVPTEEYVTLEIIDIFGNVVKTLAANELLHGTKRYVWNGDSNAGMQVSDGHYIYRLTAGTETITKKLTLLRSK